MKVMELEINTGIPEFNTNFTCLQNRARNNVLIPEVLEEMSDKITSVYCRSGESFMITLDVSTLSNPEIIDLLNELKPKIEEFAHKLEKELLPGGGKA